MCCRAMIYSFSTALFFIVIDWIEIQFSIRYRQPMELADRQGPCVILGDLDFLVKAVGDEITASDFL